MGYRIVYGPETGGRQIADKPRIRLRVMTGIMLLIGCGAVRIFWPEGTELLRRFLVPGEPTLTEQAFGTLVADLRMGEAFSEAVTAFCRTVVEQGTGLAR